MKTNIFFPPFCWFLLAFSLIAKGQELKTEKEHPAPLEHIRKMYGAHMQGQTFLFNGAEYDRFNGYAENHPFFEYDYFQLGEVQYENQQYDSIPLLYDVFLDQLIVSHLDQNGQNAALQLHKNRVKAFHMNGQRFVHLLADTLQGDHAGSGFYKLLHEGKKTKLLLKRWASKTESYDANLRNFKTTFSKRDKFFLFHEDVYHAVKSRRSILKVLKEERKALAQHIRDSDLNFRKKREQALLQVVQHYEKIQNKHD